jgi:hypothetical protein
MPQQIFTPVTASAAGSRSFIMLTDKAGRVLFVSMPSMAGAVFCAAAMQNELTKAGRKLQ